MTALRESMEAALEGDLGALDKKLARTMNKLARSTGLDRVAPTKKSLRPSTTLEETDLIPDAQTPQAHFTLTGTYALPSPQGSAPPKMQLEEGAR